MLLQRGMARGLACVVAAAAGNIAPAAEPVLATSIQEEFTAGLEQVFVFRTTRTARTRGATPGCQSAGFESNSEDVYQLWSVRTDADSARVTEADAHVRGYMSTSVVTLRLWRAVDAPLRQ